MSIFIKELTGEYPLYANDIRRQNPNVSLAIDISEEAANHLGYAVVTPTPRPEGDVVIEGKPEFRDGVYFQTWVVRDFTEEELRSEFETKKQDAISAIERATNATLKAGAEFNFGSEEAPDLGRIAMEEGDRVNVIGLKQAADRAITNNDTKPIYIRCVDGSIKAMSAQKCIDMSWAVYDSFTAVMATSWQLQGAVQAAEKVEDIPEIPYILS